MGKGYNVFTCAIYSYEGPLLDDGVLLKVLKEGLSSSHFTQLLCEVCGELKKSLELQKAVSLPQGKEDHEAFQLELRGFLNELKFPHQDLFGDLEFLSSTRNRILVLDFLVSELTASRLLLLRRSREQAMEIEDAEVSGVGKGLSTLVMRVLA